MTGNNNGSCLGFRGPVCRLWVPVIFVMLLFFFRDVPAHYNISVAHNKNLWCITKKLIPQIQSPSKPEIRTAVKVCSHQTTPSP